MSPCGNIMPPEHNASPTPRVLASRPPHSLEETRKKPPLLNPKHSPTTMVPTPSVASLGIWIWNTPLTTPILRILGL